MKIALLKFACFSLIIISCTSNDIRPQPIVSVTQDETEGNAQDDTSDDTTDDSSALDYSLLFVGNSLTYFNDLPGLVGERASLEGIDIETTTVAYGNYGLEDHWNDGEIQTMIETFDYDFVIIQQGPSSQAYGRSSLIEYGGYIKEVCAANDTELAFFMVWPSLVYYHTFPGVIQNYTDAATLNEALLCPVGEHWRDVVDQTGDTSYYGPDGFHPSLEGSEIAAQIILQSLGIIQ
ncbi:MAG: SGNH/GDSL hydrolase family protein [Gilvibacter sp.]